MWNGINFYYYYYFLIGIIIGWTFIVVKKNLLFLTLLLNPCRKLLVYPKGIYNGEMKVISLFLLCCDCVLPEHNFFAEFKISIKDQINKENHVEKIGMYAYMCVHTHVPPILFHLVMFLCKFCLNFFVLFCFVSYRKTLVHYLFEWMGFLTLYAT